MHIASKSSRSSISDLKVSKGVLDDMVCEAAHQVHVEEVVEAPLVIHCVAANRRGEAMPHRPALNLSHVHVAQRKDAQCLEQLAWPGHLYGQELSM